MGLDMTDVTYPPPSHMEKMGTTLGSTKIVFSSASIYSPWLFVFSLFRLIRTLEYFCQPYWLFVDFVSEPKSGSTRKMSDGVEIGTWKVSRTNKRKAHGVETRSIVFLSENQIYFHSKHKFLCSEAFLRLFCNFRLAKPWAEHFYINFPSSMCLEAEIW